MAENEGKRIEELSKRIGNLEESVKDVTRPYSEIVGQLSQFQDIVQKYFRLLDLYQRHGVISIDVILPEVKDPISKEIMRALMDRPGMNISQITEDIRKRKGSASRRIVSARLDSLVDKGLLVVEIGKKSKSYKISESVVKKWSQVLGLSK